MNVNEKPTERRSHHRFQLKAPALVRFKDFSSNFGTLYNVSHGGVGFRVLSLQNDDPDPLELSITIPCEPPVHMDDLLCQLIYNRNDRRFGEQLHLKSCGVKFLQLSDAQRLQLEKLIHHHTLVEDS